MLVLKIDPGQPDERAVAEAGEILRGGESSPSPRRPSTPWVPTRAVNGRGAGLQDQGEGLRSPSPSLFS
jgi:hypothetical protein